MEKLFSLTLAIQLLVTSCQVPLGKVKKRPRFSIEKDRINNDIKETKEYINKLETNVPSSYNPTLGDRKINPNTLSVADGFNFGIGFMLSSLLFSLIGAALALLL